MRSASLIFNCKNCSFLFPESDNKWKGASLIEYQRRIFREEVNDLKGQIGSFCEIWITKLDSMQVKHDEQLDSVQNWLKKVGDLFPLLSQKPLTHQTFTCSNSTKETLQKMCQKCSQLKITTLTRTTTLTSLLTLNVYHTFF